MGQDPDRCQGRKEMKMWAMPFRHQGHGNRGPRHLVAEESSEKAEVTAPRYVFSPDPVARWEERTLAWRDLITGVRCSGASC